MVLRIKDAYAPYWGFSMWDFGTGSIGSFWPVFQEYYPPAQAIDFKFSYFKRSNIYWELETQGEELYQVNFHGMMIIQTKLTG